MTRRDLAYRAFWSEHPLCSLYSQTHNTNRWSLKQLIGFAENLPEPTFRKLVETR